MVAAWLLPGVDIRSFWGALARRGDRLGAERGHPAGARRAAVAADARARLPARADRGRPDPPGHRRPDRRHPHGRQLRLGPARSARRRRRERRARRAARLGRHVVDPDRAPDRAAAGDHRLDRRPRDRLPRDRRARDCPCCACDARRERAEHGPLGARHASSRRVGDGSLLADGREPGGDPAGLERGHLGVPLGGEGDGDDDDLLGAAGLRGDRAAARHRHRPAGRRRRQPRQPPLRRGGGRDPHREPDGGGEEVEPRLPRVLRQRRQRDAHARALRLGGHPRVDGRPAGDTPGRAAARPPRRHLPADARRALRLRARPDRLRRPHRHHARPARRLRDLLELRRGRAPLRSRAGRHARGAAQARRQVRRTSRWRCRYAPRPYEIVVLSDHGQTQGATFKQRNGYGLDELVERSLAQWRRVRDRRRRRAELDGRQRVQRGDGEEGRSGRRTTSPTATSSCSARATSGSST